MPERKLYTIDEARKRFGGNAAPTLPTIDQRQSSFATQAPTPPLTFATQTPTHHLFTIDQVRAMGPDLANAPPSFPFPPPPQRPSIARRVIGGVASLIRASVPNVMERTLSDMAASALGLYYGPELRNAMLLESELSAPVTPTKSRAVKAIRFLESTAAQTLVLAPAMLLSGPAAIAAGGAGLVFYGASGAGEMQQRIEKWEQESKKTMSVAKRRALMAAAFVIDAGLEAASLGGIARTIRNAGMKDVASLASAIIAKKREPIKAALKAMNIEGSEEVLEDMSKDIVAAASFEGGDAFYDKALKNYGLAFAQTYGPSYAGGAIGGLLLHGAGRFGEYANRQSILEGEKPESEGIKQTGPSTWEISPVLFDALKEVGVDVEQKGGKRAPRGSIIRIDPVSGEQVKEEGIATQEAYRDPVAAMQAVSEDIRIKPFESAFAILIKQEEAGKTDAASMAGTANALRLAIGQVFDTKAVGLINKLATAFAGKVNMRKGLWADIVEKLQNVKHTEHVEKPAQPKQRTVNELFAETKRLITDRKTMTVAEIASTLNIGEEEASNFLKTLAEQKYVTLIPDKSGTYALRQRDVILWAKERSKASDEGKEFATFQEWVKRKKEEAPKKEAAPKEEKASKEEEAPKKEEAQPVQELISEEVQWANEQEARIKEGKRPITWAVWQKQIAGLYPKETVATKPVSAKPASSEEQIQSRVAALKREAARQEVEEGKVPPTMEAERKLPEEPTQDQFLADLTEDMIEAGWTLAEVQSLFAKAKREGRDSIAELLRLTNTMVALGRAKAKKEAQIEETEKPKRPKIKREKKKKEEEEFDLDAFNKENPEIEKSITEEMLEEGMMREEDLDLFFPESEKEQDPAYQDREDDSEWQFSNLPPEEQVAGRVESGKRSGLSVSNVIAFLKDVSTSLLNAHNVRVVQSVEELASVSPRVKKSKRFALYLKRGDTIEGVYVPGEGVYLVADGLKNRERTLKALAHEIIGHAGLRAAVGAEYDTALRQVFNSKFGAEIRALKRRLGLNNDLQATEEWFARQIEKVPLNKSLWNRIVAAIRRGLRRLFPNLEFSDTELRDLIYRSYEAAQRRTTDWRKDVAFSGREPSPWYYSKLEQMVQSGIPKKASAETFKSIIQGWIKTGKVKQAEVDASGILRMLSMPVLRGVGILKGAYSFIRDITHNTLSIQDRTGNTLGYMSLDPDGSGLIDVTDAEGERIASFPAKASDIEAKRDIIQTVFGVRYPELLSMEDRETGLGKGIYARNGTYIGDVLTDTENAGYKLHLALTNENKHFDTLEAVNQWVKAKVNAMKSSKVSDISRQGIVDFLALANPQLVEDVYTKENTYYSEFTEKGGTNYREILLRLPNTFNYVSPHFEDFNTDGLVIHLRLHDRITTDGRRILFIEEIQSDVHNRNRTVKRHAKFGLANGALTQEQADAYIRQNTVNAPFKDTYIEVALRKAISIATEEGYDGIAWTTGMQQVKRYARYLAEPVTRIEYKREDGEYHITASGTRQYDLRFDSNGLGRGIYLDQNGSLTTEYDLYKISASLADVVGPELAEKIMDESSPNEGSFESDDLSIGGHGLRYLYEVVIPSRAASFIKSTGAKPEKLPLKSGEDHYDWTYIDDTSLIYATPDHIIGIIDPRDNKIGIDRSVLDPRDVDLINEQNFIPSEIVEQLNLAATKQFRLDVHLETSEQENAIYDLVAEDGEYIGSIDELEGKYSLIEPEHTPLPDNEVHLSTHRYQSPETIVALYNMGPLSASTKPITVEQAGFFMNDALKEKREPLYSMQPSDNANEMEEPLTEIEKKEADRLSDEIDIEAFMIENDKDLAEDAEDPMFSTRKKRKEKLPRIAAFLGEHEKEIFKRSIAEVKRERIPIELLKSRAREHWTPKKMANVVAKGLRREGLDEAEFTALTLFMTVATEEATRYAEELNEKGKDGETAALYFLKPVTEAFMVSARARWGRLGNVLKLAYGRPRSIVDMMAKTELALGRILTQEEKERLKRIDWTDLDQLRRIAEELRVPNPSDLIFSLYVNNLLSGKAILSNAILNGVKLMYHDLEMFESSFFDATLSAVTWGRRARTAYMADVIPQLRAQLFGLGQGAKLGWNVLLNKTNPVHEDASILYDMGVGAINIFDKYANRYKGKIGTAIKVYGSVQNTPIRAMIAGDVLFRLAYYNSHLAKKVLKEAREAGYANDTPAFEDFVRSRLENLTGEDKREARAEAAEGIFMGKAGRLLTALKSLRNIAAAIVVDKSASKSERAVATVADLSLKLLVPFVHTLGQVTEWSAQRLPIVGLALHKGTVPEKMAAQMSGLMAAALLAYVVGSGDDDDEETIVTGYPSNAGKRLLFHARGKHVWSFKAPWTDNTYVSYENDPMHLPLKGAALLLEYLTDTKEPFESKTERLWRFALDLRDGFLESAFTDGIAKALFSSNPMSNIRNIPSGFFPLSGFWRAAIRSYEAATQGYITVPDNSKPIEDVSDFMNLLLPLGMRNLPPRLNIWGEEVHMPSDIWQEWMPYKWWHLDPKGIDAEMEHLGYTPGLPNRIRRIEGVDVELPYSLYRELVIIHGKESKRRVEVLFANPYFEKRPEALKVKLLSRAMKQADLIAARKLAVEVRKNYRNLIDQARTSNRKTGT